MALTIANFGASELNALKKFTYDEDRTHERVTKRRRMNYTFSTLSTASTAVDSGYNSEEDARKWSLAPSTDDTVFGNTDHSAESSKKEALERRRVNSEPLPMSIAQSQHFQRFVARMHPSDKDRHQNKRQFSTSSESAVASSPRDPDLEIIAAQHQIAMARQRLHSCSVPSNSAKHDKTDLGWTAGPKAACSSNIFTRVFDGVRVMDHERSFLSLLADPEETPEVQQPQVPPRVTRPPVHLSAEEKREVEREVTFAGLAMPTSFDEEDEHFQPSAYSEDAGDSGFDDFFKLDEASTPEQKCGPSP